MSDPSAAKTLVVVGFGPGISTAVAEKFGAAGFAVALVGRSAERLAAGAAALKARGVDAAGFTADAADPAQIRAALAQARAALGPIAVLHWNAFGGHEAGDLMTAEPAVTAGVFAVAVTGLIAAIQDALPDLKAIRNAAGQPAGAVLVTNGAYGLVDPQMDAFAVGMKASGVALANAAKHKLVGLLSAQLAPDGVYVGEVMVAGAVAGTPYAREGGIPAARIAEAFWGLYQARGEVRTRVS